MKSIKLIFLFLLTVVSFSFIAGCASEDTGYGAFKGMTAPQILADGEKQLSKHNYSSASKRFEAIDALYPFAKEADQGGLDAIYAYYRADEIPSALAAADKYIHIYPQGKHTDYAYYMKGLINFDRGKSWSQKLHHTNEEQRNLEYLQQAFSDFNDLVVMFPNSIYAKDAYERMRYIKSLLAKHELEVADFYFERKAYVAAANRADFVVKHFYGTPESVDALKIMIKSYRILGAKQQEHDALEILKYNYPNEKV